MKLFRWLERKVFLGEVIEDYGVIHDGYMGGARFRVSLLLCRRGDQLQFVFRQAATALLGASVHYVKIDVTSESLRGLGDALMSAHKHLNEPPVI